MLVTGWFDRPTTLTTTSGTKSIGGMGGRDVLLAQLDVDSGALGMTKVFGGSGNEVPGGVAWTGTSIVLAGSFDTSLTLGAKTLTSAGARDIWVSKLMPDGTPVWAVRLGGGGDDAYPFVATDAAGDVYVTGTVGGAASFGGMSVGGEGGLDIFVAKLRGTDGNVVWAKSFGSAGDEDTGNIAVTPGGQVAVAARIAGPITTGGSWSGDLDAIFLSYDTNGNRLWSRVVGTPSTEYTPKMAAGTGALYGIVSPGADLGTSVAGVPIIGAPHAAGLLLKFQP